MNIYPVISTTTDARQVIALTFQREPSSECIEVIYQIQTTNYSPLEPEAFVLVFLSSTRTDSREPIVLTEEERNLVVQTAANKVSEALS